MREGDQGQGVPEDRVMEVILASKAAKLRFCMKASLPEILLLNSLEQTHQVPWQVIVSFALLVGPVSPCCGHALGRQSNPTQEVLDFILSKFGLALANSFRK